jgi:hypothetical protein
MTKLSSTTESSTTESSTTASACTVSSLTELLELSHCQYRIYELGRIIEKISKKQFEQIEANQLAYPSPLQGHAQFAVVFWPNSAHNTKSQHQTPTTVEPMLWFLKLPLDERGLLIQAARNHFIAIILEALGKDITQHANETQQQKLDANPYHFTPAQYKLASLNAIIAKELKRQPSQHYRVCQHYFSSTTALAQWQNIGVQGLADFVARLDDVNNLAGLTSCFDKLPKPVLMPLCSALEHHVLPVELIRAIIACYQQTEDQELRQQLIRALANCDQHKYVQQFIEQLLQQAVSESLLIVLASRHWRLFTDPQQLMRLLEALVEPSIPADLFAPIFKDLVAIPAIRPMLFQCMRQPNRSNALANAIGQLFN